MLLTSSALIGIYFSHKLSLRVEFLRKYLSFIKYIETEIKYSADLIYDLMKKYKTTGTMKKFIDECCYNMENSMSVSGAWNLALKKISGDSGLCSNDIEIINSFGENLGKNDINGQISHCNLTSELIGSCLTSAKDNKARKSKLYFMLCLFSGFCIVLFFL